MTEDQHEKPRWIDTSAMICDPLTKAGNFKFADRLVTALSTGLFDTRATPESTLKKLAKQKNSKTMKEVSVENPDNVYNHDLRDMDCAVNLDDGEWSDAENDKYWWQ